MGDAKDVREILRFVQDDTPSSADENRSDPLPDMRRDACAGKSSIANSSAMMWRNRLVSLCALLSVFALAAWSQDAADSQAVRPSGVTGPIRKAKAVTAKETEDADVESSPARKTKTSKSTNAASHRKRAKAKETEE